MRSAVVLLLVTTAVVLGFMLPLSTPKPEALQIHNDHIVWMRVGIPHKWVRLRVRMDTSDIYLFQHPSPWSRSWTPLPLYDPYGQAKIRETIVIGTTPVRAELIVGRFPSETTTTVEGTQSEGVLGIGPQSPLWTIWRNFTKSRDHLYLGAVLPRASATSKIALPSDLLDTWMEGLHSPHLALFSMRFSATIDSDSKHAISHNCESALRSRDESADLSASLGDVLGVTPDERACFVRTDYTVVLDPDADYNIIPPVLTLHPTSRPPLFTLRSAGSFSNIDLSLKAVLFNMFDDMYVDVDTTNQAGSGMRRMANEMGFNESLIVIGSFGMRRLELTYNLDSLTGYAAIKHTGMSQSAQVQRSDHSVDVRRIRDISILIAGVLLWALLAAEPDPLFPQHASQDTQKFPHAHATGIQILRDSPPIAVTTDSTAVEHLPDGMRLVRTRGTNSDVPAQQVVAAPPKPPRDQHIKQARQLHILARNGSVQIGAVIQAAYTMESEWPISLDVLLYVQLLVDAIVGLFVVIALRFYDTAWALAMVVFEDISSDAVGWASIALIVAAILALSFASTISAGKDARLGSLCLQAEVLISLSLLTVSLFEWDLALAMLLVLVVLTGVVLMVMVLHVYTLMPQYHSWTRSPRTALRPLAAALGVAWLLYASLAVIPFAIGRLGDNKAQSALIGVFLTLSITLPCAMWLSVNTFLYPLRVSNAATKHILLVLQSQRSSVTGTV